MSGSKCVPICGVIAITMAGALLFIIRRGITVRPVRDRVMIVSLMPCHRPPAADGAEAKRVGGGDGACCSAESLQETLGADPSPSAPPRLLFAQFLTPPSLTLLVSPPHPYRL